MADFESEYLPGTCYSCQKCLYCFQLLQENSCKCKKTIQPSRAKNPKRGQQIYQRSYTPNPTFPKSNEYLFVANSKFGYNSNFEEPFSYTFCGTCNSQIQRLRSADKQIQKDEQTQVKKHNYEVDVLDDSSSEKAKPLSDTEEEEGYNIEEEEDSDLEEIKVQIIVKSKNIKAPTAKVLTIDPVSYNELMEKISLVVRKALKKTINPKDYVISYKALNARGPSSELEDELDFQEFISEYKKVFLAGKKMILIVDVKDNITKKKHKKESSAESEHSSTEEIELRCTRKKKSRAIREEDLSKEERTRSEAISTLCEMYKCNIHTTPCFIQDNRHLQLNPARLQLWAREIINKGTTYEVPPSYPTFDMKSSVSANKNNSTLQQAQVIQTSTTPAPIIIQLPSQLYQNSSFQEQPVLHNFNTNLHTASSSTLPSIDEFFDNLDQKHNCNVYTNFKAAFIEEEITVNVIKELSDEQLRKLGVVKIGWQKNIKQAAQRF